MRKMTNSLSTIQMTARCDTRLRDLNFDYIFVLIIEKQVSCVVVYHHRSDNESHSLQFLHPNIFVMFELEQTTLNYATGSRLM